MCFLLLKLWLLEPPSIHPFMFFKPSLIPFQALEKNKMISVMQFHKKKVSFLSLFWTVFRCMFLKSKDQMSYCPRCLFRISILANGSLRIWNATKSDAGLYTCIARNQFGVASSTGTLSVKGISSEFKAFECNLHCYYCFVAGKNENAHLIRTRRTT